MKIGFYDSGLGGIAVLRDFIKQFGTKYSYFYYGDSARAPYGDKTRDELIKCINDIFVIMLEEEVDVAVSACNTTSMQLSYIDLDIYPFHVISMHEVIKSFFENNLQVGLLAEMNQQFALLATASNIESQRYLEWGVNIYPLKCPDIVPLLEAGKYQEAKKSWQNYLAMVPAEIKNIIVGCTHYSFLYEENSKHSFIDPAKLVSKYFAESVFNDELLSFDSEASGKLDLDLRFSKADESYFNLANKLLMSY